MPRQPRLDSPDLLHHVIVRGIERSKIFCDDDDRRSFVDRLQRLLSETNTECYAWALIPNHFHLLLRPRDIELSRFMSRLLTGYALTFNRRHHRSGHLFQNRYKSIVCEEAPYLLELIRYIHLNPLRAKLVQEMESLDYYPWCGHADILGNGSGSGIAVGWVLSLFSSQRQSALKQYRQFIADGVDQGQRPELVGGGGRRSQIRQPDQNLLQYHDDRVLGSGDFVQQLQGKGLLDCPPSRQMSLKELQTAIADRYSISIDRFMRRARSGKVAEARIIFCYFAVRKFRHSGAEVAKFMGIGPPSVSRAVQKGALLIQSDEGLYDWLCQP